MHEEGLGSADEERKVGARVQKEIEVEADTRIARFMGAPRDSLPRTDPERDALVRATGSKDTPNADIAARLKTFRDAVTKKDGAIEKADAELHEALTLQQQAKLVLVGVPD